MATRPFPSILWRYPDAFLFGPTHFSDSAMERWSHLDDVLDLVWTYVEQGSSDSKHPFRTPTFVTAGQDEPNVRTIVLREVDRNERRLAFHSDRRAKKIADIQANSRVAWHSWDPERSLQLRLSGRAHIHTQDSVARAMWNQESPASLDLYLKPTPPGTESGKPTDGLPSAAKNGPLTREDVQAGRQHFAVVRTVIDDIDALRLGRDIHQRAQFTWNPSLERFRGNWVIP